MFPETHYADWLQQLEKDLKGKPWTDLQWHLGEGIVVDPFYHPDQYFPQRLPLTNDQNRWEIGEQILVADLKTTNQEILAALEGGVEALELQLQRSLHERDWAILLEGVQLEYIALHLFLAYAENDTLGFVQTLQSCLKGQGFKLETLRGSIDFDKNKISTSTLQSYLPGFKLAVVNGVAWHQGHTESARELASFLKVGESFLATAPDNELEALAKSILFKVAIGKSYFVEIAKLRALHILWCNVLKAYGVQKSSIAIAAHFAPDSQDENTHTNMIRAATQAMSAIVGGAQQLYVLPSNAGINEAPSAFSRRIARNVQHLLRLESHLDKVQDPAAGSFYIEKLTEELATKAWGIFQEK